MTIRRLNGRFEVKLPLVPDRLLVVQCDSLGLAQQVDKLGRFYERLVNDEASDLEETNAALQTLRSAGLEKSALFEQTAAFAARLQSES